jgi:septal ring factor EnvC (AmiA/AmiB activator)
MLTTPALMHILNICTAVFQINEFEETLCDSDGQTRNLRQMICDLKEKNVDLQEEISATLTDLQAAKESAEKLSVR